jgi:predicted RNA-binding Zn-ribbon protein involved in translation (DUF1610 family)
MLIFGFAHRDACSRPDPTPIPKELTMNKKCPNCGFINFIHAEACRKCETNLSCEDGPSIYDAPTTYRGGVDGYRQAYPTRSGSTALKVVGIVVVCVIMLGVFSALAFTRISGKRKVKWIEYHPDGANLTVMMPNKPSRLEPILTPLPSGTMSNHRYISIVSGQGTVMFCFVDFSGQMFEKDQVEQGLNDELDSFVQATKSTLISKKQISYGGLQGIEFEMSPPAELSSKASRSYGKMFLSMSRLYVFSITAAEGSDLLAGKDKFLNPQLPPGPLG